MKTITLLALPAFIAMLMGCSTAVYENPQTGERMRRESWMFDTSIQSFTYTCTRPDGSLVKIELNGVAGGPDNAALQAVAAGVSSGVVQGLGKSIKP